MNKHVIKQLTHSALKQRRGFLGECLVCDWSKSCPGVLCVVTTSLLYKLVLLGWSSSQRNKPRNLQHARFNIIIVQEYFQLKVKSKVFSLLYSLCKLVFVVRASSHFLKRGKRKKNNSVFILVVMTAEILTLKYSAGILSLPLITLFMKA